MAALFAFAPQLYSAEPIANPSAGRDLNVYQQIAEGGNLEMTLRAVDQRLVLYPDDARLLEFRAQVVGALARAADNLATRGGTAIVAPAVRPPAVANRRAEAGWDFTSEIPLIWIAPGTFMMSSTQGSDDDTLVTISRGYWLGRTEVTQEQWQVVMENIPVPSLFKGSDRPVERITWPAAMEFARKLTERERAAGRLPEGYDYALPTEAQWEYACRAGTTGSFAGDVAALTWHLSNSGGQTHAVAQKQPNAWGLYDMHGNVQEWCADGYGGYPGGKVSDPMHGYAGPSAGTFRIARGGNWAAHAGACRSAYRAWHSINYSSSLMGFRLALAPMPATRPQFLPP